jgi:hypothetical protein
MLDSAHTTTPQPTAKRYVTYRQVRQAVFGKQTPKL